MAKAGFDSLRLEREFHRPVREERDCTYVLRPHILRHFAASVMQYKLKSIICVRDWIKHEKAETTNGYLHSADALGVTADYLETASWADILGYSEEQRTLPGEAPAQTSLDAF